MCRSGWASFGHVSTRMEFSVHTPVQNESWHAIASTAQQMIKREERMKPDDSAGDYQNELGNGHAQQEEGVQWTIALSTGSGLSRDLIPATHCLPMPKSRGRKPKKNRAPPTAAPKKRLDNFNNRPQVSPFSTQPVQEPPPATAPRQEQPTSKAKTDRDDVMPLAPVPVGPE
jgi:hypothetical protein